MSAAVQDRVKEKVRPSEDPAVDREPVAAGSPVPFLLRSSTRSLGVAGLPIVASVWCNTERSES
eukprot:3572030-Amphidinium_carterae.1